MLSDNTSITNQGVLVLSPITANVIDQLSPILTNNLNLKAPIWYIYVCMITQSYFMHLHLCLEKIDIFFWTLWGNNSFSNMFIFLWTDSLYTVSKLTAYRKSFQTYITCQVLFQFIFWQKKCPKTVRRSWLNLL